MGEHGRTHRLVRQDHGAVGGAAAHLGTVGGSPGDIQALARAGLCQVLADGQAALDNFILTHAETDHLLTYPDESTITAAEEGTYLKDKAESPNEAELLAVVDGVVAGTAGFSAVGSAYKLQHRAEFGISIARAYWELGIGQALTAACIDCARKAGYTQLELDVVADNASAIALYKKFGFTEYGRNPQGFRPRNGGYQELVLMRLGLS